MPQPGVNFQGQKYFPEPVQFGGPVVLQSSAPLTTGAGIVAGGGKPAVGTVPSGAGTASAITGAVGTDQAGSFTISNANVTPTAGGTTASVTFSAPFTATPVSVNLTAANTTAGGTLGVGIGAMALAKTGFSVFMSPLGSVSSYLVSYQVFKAQP